MVYDLDMVPQSVTSAPETELATDSSCRAGQVALRDGLREVVADPVLLLIEIGWRWTFGALTVVVFLTAVFLVLGSVRVDPQRLATLSALSPLELGQNIANTAALVGQTAIRASLVVVCLITVCWIPLSAFGRYATLTRPALAPGASLRRCFEVSFARAAITLGALSAWVLLGLVAGYAGVAASPEALPNFPVVFAILIPGFLMIVTVWSALNWYTSLIPLLPVDRSAWSFLRSRSNDILEISIALGVIRAAGFIAALFFCVAVSAIVRNPRVGIADFFGISVLYFLCADFLYLVRLAGYAQLRSAQYCVR